MLNVLRSLFPLDIPVNEVLIKKSDDYANRKVINRDEALFLYAPISVSNGVFEIVLHRPCTELEDRAFSLHRAPNREGVEYLFNAYKDKVSVFIDIAKDMCNPKSLKLICDVLSEHSQWSLAHLAAYFSANDAFSHPLVNSFLNSSDPETGMSPLQVAIMRQNVKTVQWLISANCSLGHVDNDGNSVFHFAASTNQEIISALTKKSQTYLSTRNKNGHTPLHIACLSDKPDCIEAFISAGADVNVSASRVQSEEEIIPGYVGKCLENNRKELFKEDMKFGGTPLHWACSRKVIEMLCDMGCNLDLPNFFNQTALHMMVFRNRLECVMALLSRGADIDVMDAGGNTPLHLAVKNGNIPIVKALIVFGANLNSLNNDGFTARHIVAHSSGSERDKLLYVLHAAGATRCMEELVSCASGCNFKGDVVGSPPPSPPLAENRDILDEMLSFNGMKLYEEKTKNLKKGGRLLSLDGGGIRGLVLIQILMELEKVLECPIISCFDWIAGTSTGGIIVLGMATGKSLHELLCLYFRMKDEVFVGGRPYKSENLENILKEAFGKVTCMADIKHPKVMIPGLLADRTPVGMHLFRNYKSPHSVLNLPKLSCFEDPPSPEKQRLWEVARATGAAPTYFRQYGRFLDGGLIANNPTMDLLTEFHEYNLALQRSGLKECETADINIVVSFGTGMVPVKVVEGMDIYRPEGLWQTAKLALGIPDFITMIIDQATLCDGRVVDRTRAWCSMLGVPYFRFSPQLSENVEMNEKDDAKLVNMLWETKVYMQMNKVALQKMAEIIKKASP